MAAKRKPDTNKVASLAEGMKRAVAASGMSMRKLEADAGLHSDSVRNVCRRLSLDPSGEITTRVAAYLGIPAEALRGEAPWPADPPEAPERIELRKLAASAREASEKAKRAVVFAKQSWIQADGVARRLEALLEQGPPRRKRG